MTAETFTEADLASPWAAVDEAPQDFDIKAWIRGAKLPERSATVYGRADLVAEYEDLDQQLTAARQSTGSDDRLADTQSAIARRMDEVRREMKASALTFRFRALSKDEQRQIRESAPKEPNGDLDTDYVTEHTVAASCYSPTTLTLEDVSDLRGKIGEGQWVLLWDAAAGASQARVNVPFSLAASVTLSSQES